MFKCAELKSLCKHIQIAMIRCFHNSLQPSSNTSLATEIQEVYP